MSRFLKVVGFSIGGVVLLACVGVAGLYAWSGAEISRKSPVPPHAFTAPRDSASIARGEHLLRAIGKCSECHGQDLGGGVVVDEPAVGRIVAPNLTIGSGGASADFSDELLERAIRHGVAGDGRRLIIMPSNEYQHLSDEDVGAIIAYIRSVPPVDRQRESIKVGPMLRALYLAGQMPLFPGAEVRHGTEIVPVVPVDTSVAYGRYLGQVGCAGCHGATFAGGKSPGEPPDWPPAANLTPTGIGHYTFEGFETALRTGKRPDGSAISQFMPVNTTKLMTDVEIRAVWNYLRTLEPREFGLR